MKPHSSNITRRGPRRSGCSPWGVAPRGGACWRRPEPRAGDGARLALPAHLVDINGVKGRVAVEAGELTIGARHARSARPRRDRARCSRRSPPHRALPDPHPRHVLRQPCTLILRRVVPHRGAGRTDGGAQCAAPAPSRLAIISRRDDDGARPMSCWSRRACRARARYPLRLEFSRRAGILRRHGAGDMPAQEYRPMPGRHRGVKARGGSLRPRLRWKESGRARTHSATRRMPSPGASRPSTTSGARPTIGGMLHGR
jgi:hypothetical protein